MGMDATWGRALVLGAAVSAVLASGAQAATIDVDTTADVVSNDPNCSLREAITSANDDSNAAEDACALGSGPDTINVPAGTYQLSGATGENANASGDLDVIHNNATSEAG